MSKDLSMEDAFVNRLKSIVKENLDNEQFSVEYLAREAGLSRSQIHRKLRKITGQSTSRFIRHIRLKQAKKLLENRVGNVSEVAYRVGFSNTSYFSKCFHEQYGIPPGRIIANKDRNKTADTLEEDKGVKKISSLTAFPWNLVGLIVFLSILITSVYIFQDEGPVEKSQKKALAILPLHNLTGDTDQEYFVDGLHDALIGELGQLNQLRVISRTSTLQFRNPKTNMKEIADKLGVDLILEGSVYKTEDRVRIQIQLIKVDQKERHIWSKHYNRDTRNILAMFSDVTRDVAKNVNISFSPRQDSLLANRRRVNPEAYKAFLRGRYLLNSYKREDYKRGINYLMEAVRIDPGEPLPWAQLALGYNAAGHGIDPPEGAFEKAQIAAQKALALDRSLGEVHLSLALVDLYKNWKWKAAEEKFRKALKYDPNLAEAHAHYSWLIPLRGGSLTKLVEEQKKAIRLDPFTSLYPAYLAHFYWFEGNYDEGLVYAQKSIDLNPEFAYGYYVLGGILAELKEYDKAIQAHKTAIDLNPDWKFALSLTYALQGRIEEGRAIAEEASKDIKPIETFGLAEFYATIGEYEQAYKWLEACRKMRFSWYPWIYWDPYLDPLKGDRKFKRLLRELNLPDENYLTKKL